MRGHSASTSQAEPALQAEKAKESSSEDERDEEMERDIASTIGETDVLKQYDLKIEEEGEAIKEYMAYLLSMDTSAQSN